MQFTTAVLALFASTALALPGSPVQERQPIPTAYVRVYEGGGCNAGPWLEDYVFVQNTDECVNVDINTIPPYGSFNVTGNTLTDTVRVYTLPNCDRSQGSFDIAAGRDYFCIAQRFRSWEFI